MQKSPFRKGGIKGGLKRRKEILKYCLVLTDLKTQNSCFSQVIEFTPLKWLGICWKYTFWIGRGFNPRPNVKTLPLEAAFFAAEGLAGREKLL